MLKNFSAAEEAGSHLGAGGRRFLGWWGHRATPDLGRGEGDLRQSQSIDNEYLPIINKI